MVPFDLWSNLKSSTPLPRGNFLMMVPCPVSSTAGKIPLSKYAHQYPKLLVDYLVYVSCFFLLLDILPYITSY